MESLRNLKYFPFEIQEENEQDMLKHIHEAGKQRNETTGIFKYWKAGID